jgi:TIGR03009 family protein
MRNGALRNVVQYIRHITPPGPMDDIPDGQLLECFIDHADEAAFATLLRRHGPLVLTVCRRALPCVQDVEDAFQATFLVLARSARSIAKRGSVASWLHGVAHRIARRARADIARRRAFEGCGRPAASPDCLQDLVWQDLRSILDEEVSRLPEKYRAAFVLCYMEGKSNEEAARLLGCPRGTVSSRLVRARALLRERLTGRGLALSAAFITTGLSGSMTSAAVPGKLAGATVRAALLVGAGRLADAGVVSAQVITLMQGGLKTMTKLKMAAMLLLPLGMIVAGTGALALQKAPAEPAVVAEENPKVVVDTGPEEPPDPPPPPVRAAVEPPLNLAEKYLALCEKALKGSESFEAQVQRTSTDRTFESSEIYDGTVKYLKPGMSLYEGHKKGEPQVMEKYVLTGSTLYEYHPSDKRVRVHDVSAFRPLPWEKSLSWCWEPVFVPFSLPMKAAETRRSFHCKLAKEDQWYLYIELTPRTREIKADFQRARLVLMKQTHLPRQLWWQQPNGNEITWDIPKIEVNVPLQREEFTKPKIPQGWKLVRVPREPEGRPKKEAPSPDDPSDH